MLSVWLLRMNYLCKKSFVMDNILIQPTSDKAYQLIKELEELQIIKVITKPAKSKQKLSEKYRGKMSSSFAAKLKRNINKSRKEWEERDI